MAAYGDILGRTETNLPHVRNNFRVRVLLDVMDMDADFFHHLLPQALEVGRQCLAQRLGTDAGPIAFSRHRHVRAARPPTSIRAGEQPLVLGAMRLSRDWSSQSPQDTALFDQLLGYADQGATRYGFAVTDTEFVVTQAYQLEGGMAIRYHTIPIGASGTDELTPALALWCLVMMSLNQHHRQPAPAAETCPFNIWYVDVRENGEVTYMHHLSRVVRATEPPPEGRQLLTRHL